MGQVYDCVTFRDWRQSASLNMRPPALRGGQPLADDRRPLKPEARRPLYHRQQKKTQKRTKKKKKRRNRMRKKEAKNIEVRPHASTSLPISFFLLLLLLLLFLLLLLLLLLLFLSFFLSSFPRLRIRRNASASHWWKMMTTVAARWVEIMRLFFVKSGQM